MSEYKTLTGLGAYPLGDLDLSGDVNSTDLGLLLNNFSATSGVHYCGGELDADSLVNSTDLGLLLNNFGVSVSSAAASAVAVPEPATFSTSWALLIATFFGLRSTGRSKALRRIERV